MSAETTEEMNLLKDKVALCLKKNTELNKELDH